MSQVNITLNTNTVDVNTTNNQIVVTDPTNPNVVNITQPVTSIVEVITAGPQGAPGPAGAIPNTGSFATTGSNQFNGNQTITGSLTVSGDSLINGLTVGKGNGQPNFTEYNTALGISASYSNQYGLDNTAIGYLAYRDAPQGNYNTAIGSNAMRGSNSGATNTAIGSFAFSNAVSINNSIGLGYNTQTLNTNDVNSIVIGANAVGLGTNTVVIGDDFITTTALKGSVGIGTTTLTSKLQVKGSGATTATTALRVENTNASASLVVNDAGNVLVGTATNTGHKLLVTGSGTSGSLNVDGTLYVSGSRVGIGTATPLYPLQVGVTNAGGGSDFTVQTSTSAAKTVITSQAAEAIIGANPQGSTTNGVPAGASFGSTTNGSRITFGFLGASAGGGTYLNFSTNGANSGLHVTHNFGSDLMTVTNGGKVGIGHPVPTASLHISGATASTLFQIDSPASSSILFVSGSGNVGLGTNTPQTKLEVYGTNELLRFGDGTSANDAYMSFNSRAFLGFSGLGGMNLISVNTRPIIFGRGTFSSYTESARFAITTGNLLLNSITDSGHNLYISGSSTSGSLNVDSTLYVSGSRVGIGTSTPLASLHISGASSANLLRIDSPASSSIIFVSGSGNVGVGTAAPAYRLDVSGSSRFVNTISYNGNLTPLNTAAYSLGISSSAGGAQIIAYSNNGLSAIQSLEFGFQNTSLNSSGSFSNPVHNNYAFRIYGNYVTSSIGGGTLSSFLIAPTLNFAGNTNAGVYRGFYHNPTLTNLTNTTHRAIETATGDVIFGSTSGNVGIGTSNPNSLFHLSGSSTATSSLARGGNITPTLVASANSDTLVGLDIAPNFINGAFTGVQNIGLRITTDGAGGGVLGGLLVRTSGGTTLFSVDRQFGIVNIANQLRCNSLQNSTGGNHIYFLGDGRVNINANGTGLGISFHYSQFGTELLRMFTGTGNLLIQNGGTYTDAGFRLDVSGSARVTNGLTVTGSLIINPTGSFVLPLSQSSTPQTGSAYWSGSLLFVYNGTRYMSASFF
jgi:hypothetical protein